MACVTPRSDEMATVVFARLLIQAQVLPGALDSTGMKPWWEWLGGTGPIQAWC